MVVKTIDLLVLQNKILQRIELAEIHLGHPLELTYYANPAALQENIWVGIGEQYKIKFLVQNYVEGIKKVQRLITEITSETPDADKANLETITEHPFVYASPEAYRLVKPRFRKEKKDDGGINPVAHISWKDGTKYGIFVSLEENSSYNDILASNIHEHGHYIHYRLCPEKYNNCDKTMREVMALFMETKCGMPINYKSVSSKKETSPIRAENLLRKLEQKMLYQSTDTAFQWSLLADYSNHKNLEEFIDDILK